MAPEMLHRRSLGDSTIIGLPTLRVRIRVNSADRKHYRLKPMGAMPPILFIFFGLIDCALGNFPSELQKPLLMNTSVHFQREARSRMARKRSRCASTASAVGTPAGSPNHESVL